MEENKDKREQGNELPEEDTIVFRRVVNRGASDQSRPQSVDSMQNTAQIQGGAIIRPLKSGQATRPSQSPQPSPPRMAASQPPSQRPMQPTSPRPAQQNGQRPIQPQPTQQRPSPQQPTQLNTQRTTQPRVPQNPQRPLNSSANRPTPPTSARPTVPPSQSAANRPMQNTQQAANRPAQNPQQASVRPSANASTTPQSRVVNPNQPQASHPMQNPSQMPRTQASPQRPAPSTQLPQAMQRAANQAQPQRNLPTTQQSHQAQHPDFEIDEATYLSASQRKKREKNYSYAADSATSAIMSLVKAVVYIVAIIAVSVALSMFVINTANDVFKFVGEEKLVTVEIPEYATIEDIGEILYEAEIIKYPWAFNLWGNLKEDDEKPPVFIAGTYEISTMLNYDYLRSAFKKSTARSEVRITIPEGYTVDEIITLFVEEHNIGTREGFVEAINNYDFEYRFLDGLTLSENRTYRLEGYLFPDTYYFYSDSSEVAVLNKLLDNFNTKFIEEYYDRCTDLGMSIDDVITLASMVEKEARYADELGNISSVFHNRLKYSASFPYLQSDATIMYAIHHDTGARLETMTGEDTEYESPYNTYTHKGLPPGPIANPGLNAIVYALYPSDTEYFFFVANSHGRSLFAKTGPEHEQNIIIARGN